MAFGGACYFVTQTEPNFMWMIVGCAISMPGFITRRLPVLVRGMCIGVFGFCYAAIYTNLINTPIMPRNMHNVEIRGTVTNIDRTTDKVRISLDVPAHDINAGNGRATIRVSGPLDFNSVSVGDVVDAQVGLFRPSYAYAPETFDYSRWAYFNKLTATGYFDNMAIVGHDSGFNINKIRHEISTRANSPLVDSLVLGYKNAIPEYDDTIWTAAGVGHVWSISGFHMTLVGGWIFAIWYLIFRAIPGITRRTSARIGAMCAAGVGLMFYLFLSGTDVATVRAFLMTIMMFAAFILGRNAITMRNVAVAFCVLYLVNPHNVMQAGFQLSFAAVFGLVWMFSVVKPRMPRNKVLRWSYGYLLTSIVAMIFTAPFIAMHFGIIPTYSLIGNMILLPIFSVAIMPLVMIGVVAALMGIGTPINIANMVYDGAFNIAKYIADLPYATINVPHIPNMALMFMIVGLICMILVRPIKIKINWILCAVFCAIGIGIVYVAPRPIFYSTHDNELVGFVGADGNLEFNKSRASNHFFAFDTWKQINGEDTGTPNRRREHDAGLYRYGDIVYAQRFMPLMKNIETLCADDGVRYIVSYLDIKSEQCGHKILRGGFVIYPGGRVRRTQQNRRWN